MSRASSSPSSTRRSPPFAAAGRTPRWRSCAATAASARWTICARWSRVEVVRLAGQQEAPLSGLGILRGGQHRLERREDGLGVLDVRRLVPQATGVDPAGERDPEQQDHDESSPRQHDPVGTRLHAAPALAEAGPSPGIRSGRWAAGRPCAQFMRTAHELGSRSASISGRSSRARGEKPFSSVVSWARRAGCRASTGRNPCKPAASSHSGDRPDPADERPQHHIAGGNLS